MPTQRVGPGTAPPHALSAEQTLRFLATSETGLSEGEAKTRLTRYGSNELTVRDGAHLLRRLAEPFLSPFVAVLLFAAIINLATGHRFDFLIILLIVLTNAAVVWFQQSTANRVLKTLRQSQTQTVRVRRDGAAREIPARELVPGDLVLLSAGDQVPADGRLIEVNRAEVDESKLTGESVLVPKSPDPLPAETPIFEQRNMVFRGTLIRVGQATCVISATGAATELGRIADLSQETFETPPIQAKINHLTYYLVIAVVVVATLTVFLGILRAESAAEISRLAVALSVSAVPEGLPIAITIILLLGVERLARNRALIRRMTAVETLGAVTLIAIDKTGTLTDPEPTIGGVRPQERSEVVLLGARLAIGGDGGHRLDPMDSCLLEVAPQTPEGMSPLASLPFDQPRRVGAAVWERAGQQAVYVKGAPESVRGLLGNPGELAPAAIEELTRAGGRVIAVAWKALDVPHRIWEDSLSGLRLIGLVGFEERIRDGVIEAINEVRGAGIRVVMLTGDHPQTAEAVGRRLGILGEGGVVLGSEIEPGISYEQNRVFARVLPEHKYQLLARWKRHQIIAMTGDGVNDAPALVGADVGVALGSGTEVAKEAADIILLDDNFATIARAVRSGRAIYANIRRMIFYLLSTNLGEVLVILGSLVMGLAVPVTPAQILWINLVTDGASVIPLGLEPPEEDVMKLPPRKPSEGLIARVMLVRLFIVAGAMAAFSLGIFALYLEAGVQKAQTMVFLSLVVMQWANAWNARSERLSLFRYKSVNWKLLLGIGIAALLQVLAFVTPLGEALGLSEIRLRELALPILSGLGVIVAVESHKYWMRRRSEQKPVSGSTV